MEEQLDASGKAVEEEEAPLTKEEEAIRQARVELVCLSFLSIKMCVLTKYNRL